MQLTLTPKMTTAQIVETSVTINNNSPVQNYVQSDDQTLRYMYVEILKVQQICVEQSKMLIEKFTLVQRKFFSRCQRALFIS